MYDKDKYYLLIYYFRYMLQNHSLFMDVLLTMAEEIDMSTEHIGYAFANNCDEEDYENGEGFENGVMFFFGNEVFDEIIVDYTMYYNCLKLACDVYIEENPEYRDVIKTELEKIRKRYNL